MRENKGITLIALIITIIILIILTAITLNNIIGTDLIGFATKAAENYTDAGKEEANAINDIMNIASGIGNGGTGEATPKETLEVKVQIEEEQVTGETIPIKLEALKGGENLQDVTYTAYLTPEGENEQAGVQITSDTHTFDSLDQMKDYTIRVVALGPDGVQGENTVTVKALAIKYTYEYTKSRMVYKRYTDGMTWREWAESDYDRLVDDSNLHVITEYLNKTAYGSNAVKATLIGVEEANFNLGATEPPEGFLYIDNYVPEYSQASEKSRKTMDRECRCANPLLLRRGKVVPRDEPRIVVHPSPCGPIPFNHG